MRRIRGRNGIGFSAALSFPSCGSASLKRRSPGYQIRRLERDLRSGDCQCFRDRMLQPMSFASANSMLEWQVPALPRRAVVESVEVKVASAEEIRRLSGIIPAEIVTYFEIPLSSCADCIGAMAECGRSAKIRTGGETADKFPASASVIEFIRECAAANVPFKATAGLHHPLRSVHRFTYQPESASEMMHGFLNLFLAAAFLRAGMADEVAIELLEERSPAAFHFDLNAVAWREHRLGRDEIAAARRDFAISFGSCSFTEPIDDLRSLHLL